MAKMHVIEIASHAAAARYNHAAGVAPLDAASGSRHAPFHHFAAIRNDACVARCSVWTTGTPTLDQNPVGVVGHYAALDAHAGVMLLRHATDVLSTYGFATVVGPMDGNTWRRYRLVTERGDEPPFFLEPDNPDDWPSHFTAAGFTPLATYSSALNDDLSVTDPRVPRALERLAAEGVKLRTIDLARFEDDLKAVHALSVEAFANNFLYTPLGQAEFLAMYAPLRDAIRPELVLLAEQSGTLVGFIFGVPDLLEARRGERPRTALAKSMAVRPGRAGAGLGSVLMDGFQQAARAAGFTRVIHALMHDSNPSVAISHRYGRTMRRYTLFANRLTA